MAYIQGMRQGEKNAPAGFFGVLAFGIIFGAIGVLIPTSLGPYITYLAYPIGHFILIIGVILAWSRRKRKTA
jgi:hypothetical protein